MLDLSWGEIFIIGIVALIVVGPKELPVLFRKVGQFVGRMRGMAREFSAAMNQAADESGVREAAKGLQAAANPVQSTLDGIKSSAKKTLDPNSATGKLAAEQKAKAAKIKADADARRAAAAEANAISAQSEFAAPPLATAAKPTPVRFPERPGLGGGEGVRNRNAARSGVSRARGTTVGSKSTAAARAAMKRRAGKPPKNTRPKRTDP